jgi:hypothetical protein
VLILDVRVGETRHHHSREVATRRIPALLNAIGETVADKVDEQASIPYSFSCTTPP